MTIVAFMIEFCNASFFRQKIQTMFPKLTSTFIKQIYKFDMKYFNCSGNGRNDYNDEERFFRKR